MEEKCQQNLPKCEKPMASDTGGVKAFSIQGRLYRERERCWVEMTDAQREFRKQWIQDQRLAKFEPLYIHELYLERNNIFKRIFKMPLDILFKPLTFVANEKAVFVIRTVVGRCLMGIALVYAGTYYMKYNKNDWTRKGSFSFTTSRTVCLNEEGYPHKAQDYFDKNHLKTIQDRVEDLKTKKCGQNLPHQKDEESKDLLEDISEQGYQEILDDESFKIKDVSAKKDLIISKAKTMDIKDNELTEEVTDEKEKYRSIGSYYNSSGFEKSPI